jgi:hypothetical protein
LIQQNTRRFAGKNELGAAPCIIFYPASPVDRAKKEAPLGESKDGLRLLSLRELLKPDALNNLRVISIFWPV